MKSNFMESFEFYQNEIDILHYGKKGMKWGVIRTAEQLGHIVKSAKSLYDSHKTKKRAKEEAAIVKKRSKANITW